MAAALLTLLLLLAPLVTFGGVRGELCLACHPRHGGGGERCSSCHRGNPATTRPTVAHAGLVRGRHLRYTLRGDPAAGQGELLVERYGCRRCHVIDGRGNRLAVTLDAVVRTRSSAALTAALDRPAAAMPDFRLDRAGIDLLLNALYAAGSRANPGGSPPQPVHFRSGAARERDPFSVRCGPCHRALTHEGGLLGTGSIGPNLSGLLSPFYPSGPSSPPWSPRRLTDWLRNPRSLRPWSTMGPVAVTPAEQRQIVTILSISPPHSELPGIHP